MSEQFDLYVKNSVLHNFMVRGNSHWGLNPEEKAAELSNS